MTKKLMRTVITAILVFLLNIPVIMMLNISLKSYDQTLTWPITWFEAPLQWQNYVEILVGKKNIIGPLLNSFIVAFTTMLICSGIGVLAAYATVRFKFKGKRLFLYIILVLQMVSPVLLSGPLYMVFYQLKLLDTRVALIIANTASCLPMTIWLLYSYFKQVPWYLEEAAMLDGCSRIQAISKITLPIALPGIITAGIFAFISAWGDFVYARTAIVSDALQTLPLALVKFEELYKTHWELQLAASTLSIIPIFMLFMVIQNHLGLGLMRSGNKE